MHHKGAGVGNPGDVMICRWDREPVPSARWIMHTRQTLVSGRLGAQLTGQYFRGWKSLLIKQQGFYDKGEQTGG